MTKKQKKKIKEKIGEFLLIILVLIGYQIYQYYFAEDEEQETIPSNVELRTNQTAESSFSASFQVYFIDVGQADCILIQNNGEYALIDAGNNGDGPKLVSYFQQLGIQSFRYVFGTHAHEDHIGGMDDVIDHFSIDHFFMPDVITTTKTFEDILNSLEAKQIAFETPNVDETFTMADTKFTVLWVGTDSQDLNDTSIVLKVNYKDTSYLFTGDATSTVERKILNKNLGSDVLKVGHHGSQYSSIASFLKAVHPKYAIIEVGKDNDYGHPKDVVLQKLKTIGAEIYRTDRDGTIIASSDGKHIVFEKVLTDTNG